MEITQAEAKIVLMALREVASNPEILISETTEFKELLSKVYNFTKDEIGNQY